MAEFKEGRLLRAKAALGITVFGGDDGGGLFGTTWAQCWFKLSPKNITYEDTDGDSGGTLDLTSIVAVQPEEVEDIPCLLLKVQPQGTYEDDAIALRIRSMNGHGDDLREWKLAILRNVECARDEERMRNGQVIRSPSIHGASSPRNSHSSQGEGSSSGPNTRPKSSESPQRSQHNKLDDKLDQTTEQTTEQPENSAWIPYDVETKQKQALIGTISLKGRDFVTTPRDGETEQHVHQWALQKEQAAEEAAEGKLWQAKWEEEHERSTKLQQELQNAVTQREDLEKEHEELVIKLEAMREEEVSEWRERVIAAEQALGDADCLKADEACSVTALAASEARLQELEEAMVAKQMSESRVQELEMVLASSEEEHQELITKLEAMREEDTAALESQLAACQDQLEAARSSVQSGGPSEQEWETRTKTLLEEQKAALKEVMEARIKEACEAAIASVEQAQISAAVADAVEEVKREEKAKLLGTSSEAGNEVLELEKIKTELAAVQAERDQLQTAINEFQSKQQVQAGQANVGQLLAGVAEEEEEASTLYELMDLDQDGSVNMAEFRSAASELLLSEDAAEALFRQLDSDANGEISMAEFISGYGSLKAARDAAAIEVWELFQATDKDSSGSIDIEEFQGAARQWGMAPDAAWRLFKRLDTAGKGELQVERFVEGLGEIRRAQALAMQHASQQPRSPAEGGTDSTAKVLALEHENQHLKEQIEELEQLLLDQDDEDEESDEGPPDDLPSK